MDIDKSNQNASTRIVNDSHESLSQANPSVMKILRTEDSSDEKIS